MARKLAIACLVLWLGAGTVLGGVLLVRHVVALPTPTATDTTLRDAVAALAPATGRWRAVHVMYRACPCSRRTIDHLIARAPVRGVDEFVLVVVDGDDDQPFDATPLRAAGFAVATVAPDVLAADYHVEAAPLLVIARPDGELAYTGGYNRRKQSPRYEDVAILGELMADRSAGELPVFGCATSERLSRALDPFRLFRK